MGLFDSLVLECTEFSLREKINEGINEALSINSEVNTLTKHIAQLIENDLRLNKLYKMNILNGVGYQNGKIMVMLGGQPLNVNYSCYNFRDKNTFDEFKNKKSLSLPIFNAKYSVSGNIKTYSITVDICTISGFLDKNELSEALQHEINHVFQYIKQGDNVKGYKFDGYEALLRRKDDITKGMGVIFYLSDPSEQDAYVNELYRYLQNRGSTDVRYDIEGSPTWDKLVSLKNAVKLFYLVAKHESKKEYNKRISSIYPNMTAEKLVKIGEEAVNRFTTKIGKALVKYKEDFIDSHVIVRDSSTEDLIRL